MKRIINIDKHGNIIEDLTQVELPRELELSIYETLNPVHRMEAERYDSHSV